MKTQYKGILAPMALALAGALTLYGCGGGGGGSGGSAAAPGGTATVVAPVVNTPLDGVTVTLSCSDGTVGGSNIAKQGSVAITVPTTCLTPYTMVVSGKGTMAGPDLMFGTADDEAYDSTMRTALKSVIQSTDLGLPAGAALTAGSTVNAPAMTAITTMIAESVGKPNPSAAEISAAMTKVAGVTGLPVADLYKNPMTNGNVFQMATLANEMVAAAVKDDPTLTAPNNLIKAMASSMTAKLTDTTIDPANLMGLSAATSTVLQAQMPTIQAKATAMKAVADAVDANVANANQAGLMPADAANALAAALKGPQASAAQAVVANAQIAQDTLTQMATQMAALRNDPTVAPADLAARMVAIAQGMDVALAQQMSNLQTLISSAGIDPTTIANEVMQATQQAQSMIAGLAPALMSSVLGATTTNLQTSGFMSATVAAIVSQIDPAALVAAMTAAAGDPNAALASMGLNPAMMASTAAASASQLTSLNLTPPAALASYPTLAAQVVNMVIARATLSGSLTTGKLQDWVNAIGTALAKNDPTLLNSVTVGATVQSWFATNQPDLTKAPPTGLTMTVVAGTTFTMQQPITIGAGMGGRP